MGDQNEFLERQKFGIGIEWFSFYFRNTVISVYSSDKSKMIKRQRGEGSK